MTTKARRTFSLTDVEFDNLKGTPEYLTMLRQCYIFEEIDYDTHNEAILWVKSNATDLFLVETEDADDGSESLVLYFLSDVDAIHFQMRWVG